MIGYYILRINSVTTNKRLGIVVVLVVVHDITIIESVINYRQVHVKNLKMNKGEGRESGTIRKVLDRFVVNLANQSRYATAYGL